MKLVLICLLTGLAMFTLASNDVEVSEAPNWVDSIPWNDINIDSKDDSISGTRYILVDRQKKYSDAQSYEYFNRYVEKPMTQDALMESGRINIYFQPAFQRVVLHKVQVLRDGKLEDRFGNARVRVLDVETESESHLYSEEKQIMILIKDFLIGDVLEVSYSIIGRNPVFGNKVASEFSLGWGVPVDRIFNKLVYPASRKVQQQIVNSELSPAITNENGYIHNRINIDDSPGYHVDENTPAWVEPYPFIQYSEYSSWGEVSDWAKDLFQYQTDINEGYWATWVKDFNSVIGQEKRILKALELVQENIRYVGIEVGENSHRPHSPQETLSNGYGDCKDKTLLLIALLRELGFDAEPVLVNTHNKQAISSWLPMPIAFNHVIAGVRFRGDYYYLDPTLSYQKASRLGQLGYYTYGHGLPIKSNSDLVEMPVFQGSVPEITIEETYTSYSYDLPVQLTISSIYTGVEAEYQRYRFQNWSMKDISQQYLDYYSNRFGSVEVKEPLRVVDSAHSNTFEIIESYWVSDFWQYNESDSTYEYSINASAMTEYFSVSGNLQRQHAYQFIEAMEINQKILVHYPEHYRSDNIEAIDKKFSNDYFSLSLSNQDFGGVASYQYYLESFGKDILETDIDVHAKLIEQASDYLYYSGWVSTSEEYEDSDNVKNYVRELLNFGGLQ